MSIESKKLVTPEVRVGDKVLLSDTPKNAIFTVVDEEHGTIALQRSDNGVSIPFGFAWVMEQEQNGKWQIAKTDESGRYFKSLLFVEPKEVEVTIADFSEKKYPESNKEEI